MLILLLLLLEAMWGLATPNGALGDTQDGRDTPAPNTEGGNMDSVRKENVTEMLSLAELLNKARERYQGRQGSRASRDRPDARRPSLPRRLPSRRRSIQSHRLDNLNSASDDVKTKDGQLSDNKAKIEDEDTITETPTTEIPTTTDWEYEKETTMTSVNIFDGQYHEVNPGQYQEENPGEYHEVNPGQYHAMNEGQYQEKKPGQYEAVVQFNENDETKSYNVHRKTGDYIIGEVGKIDINNGQTLEGVRYTAVEGMVDQAQIAEILRRYFGAGRR